MWLALILGIIIGVLYSRMHEEVDQRVDNGGILLFGAVILGLLVIGGSYAILGWVLGLLIDVFVLGNKVW